ncbi:sulfurtransferase complex subunit TusB [Porticoccus sp. W117]|uniref:sulfurtransferase complex subunit TusB n=1 Tax=Porticoccus sp. W117 TaxID=3054777 RepID=UPI002597C42B|nr:sulfurtransferase complex subunit TusB [Porticoccus sp. W117]MDM3871696.1 sulfurtransferase complex subunit TusB [Porticoccus sp. W117]
MILHTVNKSPFNNQAYDSCLRNLGADDVVLLLEDGVYGVLALEEELPNNKVFALKGDIAARGLGSKVPPQVTVVDYPEFVQLACEASAVQSWY